jgi:hypothetical protein
MQYWKVAERQPAKIIPNDVDDGAPCRRSLENASAGMKQNDLIKAVLRGIIAGRILYVIGGFVDPILGAGWRDLLQGRSFFRRPDMGRDSHFTLQVRPTHARAGRSKSAAFPSIAFAAPGRRWTLCRCAGRRAFCGAALW